MKLTCLFGRHWSAAALSGAPIVDGYQASHCADCGTAMEKSGRTDWHARDPWSLKTLAATLIDYRVATSRGPAR